MAEVVGSGIAVMTERAERFRSRRRMLESRAVPAPLSVFDDGLVQSLLSQDVDLGLIESVVLKEPDLEVTDEDVRRCLSDLDKSYSREKYRALFDGVKETLIDQSLGAAFRLSRADLMGSDRKFKYEDVKKDYGSGFDTTRERLKKERQNPDGTIPDAYNTGKDLGRDEVDLDHTVSKKELHDGMGLFMGTPEERKKAANDPANLHFTDKSNNRSKKSDPLEGWEASQPGKTDRRRTKPADKRARKRIEEEHSIGPGEIARRGMKDGLKVGARQGRQQALARLLSEVISAVFDEVKDVFENGWKGGKYDLKWLDVLKERLDRVMGDILAKWKDVAVAFGTGWLSGFLSATVTALLNMFVRTGKNIVRVIREGFMSIVNAIKVLLRPPDNMNLGEAAHEASKVFATGLAVTGGILAGEAIEEWLTGVPFADLLASVLGGLVSGLGSLFVVFMLDKLDLFGVSADERHAFIMGKLEDRMEGIAAELGLVEPQGSRLPPSLPPGAERLPR